MRMLYVTSPEHKLNCKLSGSITESSRQLLEVVRDHFEFNSHGRFTYREDELDEFFYQIGDLWNNKWRELFETVPKLEGNAYLWGGFPERPDFASLLWRNSLLFDRVIVPDPFWRVFARYWKRSSQPGSQRRVCHHYSSPRPVGHCND